MTIDEIRKCVQAILQHKQYKLTPYTKHRMEQRNITTKHLLTTFRRFHVVEYKLIETAENKVHRILIESVYDVQVEGRRKPQKIKLVVSLPDAVIITVYTNDADDDHPNLDLAQYDETLEIEL